jgi:uncharacterized membrane protein YdbT with pleckstrin-like domain
MGYVEKNLGPGETVVYRARYHWIAYKTALLLLLLSFLLGAASLYALKVSPEDETMSRITGMMALAFLGFALLAFGIRWVRASADEYAVTSRRVIRKYGLLSREVEQALLEKIQDITIRQGFIARLLGYGTVVVETASETGRMVFPDIANPESLRTALWGQATSPAAPASPPAAAMPAARERLAELEELKSRGLLSPEEYSSKRQEILSSL